MRRVSMISLFLNLLATIRAACRTRAELALENLAKDRRLVPYSSTQGSLSIRLAESLAMTRASLMSTTPSQFASATSL